MTAKWLVLAGGLNAALASGVSLLREVKTDPQGNGVH